MAREKVKCAKCGKRFVTNNSRQIKCDDCLREERAQLALQKSSASTATIKPRERPALVITGPAAKSLVSDVSVRPSAPVSVAAPSVTKPELKAEPITKPQEAAKRNEKPLQPPPFVLTSEIRKTIENRYLQLLNPVEWDGIRGQIAEELNVPKAVVRQVVREVRVAHHIPSWWELQAFKGTDDELDQIRKLYVPMLPVPPLGAHKQIAEQLHMDQRQVYRGIFNIRAELHLPRFNEPSLHPELAASLHQPQEGTASGDSAQATVTKEAVIENNAQDVGPGPLA